MSNQLVNYDEQWAKQAQYYAQQETQSGGTFLSTRAGVLSFGEEEMPGNQACVIVLDAVKENTLYEDRFNPEQAAAPICYAFGRGEDEMAPHPTMQADPEYFQPQNATCAGCKWNEWGSSDKGRGKACQNRRRLALIPAGYYAKRRGSNDLDLNIFTDPAHFQAADIAFLKLPVTSVDLWSKYTKAVSGQLNRPVHGVISRLFLEPHPKYQYQVHWEVIDKVPNEIAAAVMARHDEAIKAVIQGYQRPEERQAAAAPQGSLRGLRRR